MNDFTLSQIRTQLEDSYKIYSPIIKKKGFDPAPVAGKIPDFANSILYPDVVGSRLHTEFWLEQIDRCINGYRTGGIDIPGRYYYYLNFKTIDGPGGPTIPYFVDSHYQVACVIEEVKKNGLPGIIEPKKRRFGASFWMVAVVDHGYRFIKRYRAGVAAGLETYSDGFRLKLYRIYNVGPPEFRINHLTRSGDEFKIGYEEHTPQGWQEYLNGTVLFETMKDKAEKMEGEYFNDVILEESGQFPLVSAAAESIIPALKDGERFIGTMYIQGTGGDMSKSSKQFKELYHSAETLGFVRLFVPGKRYYVPYLMRKEGEVKIPNLRKKHPNVSDEQLLGCEDHEAAQAAIDKLAAEYAKLPEKAKYIKHKQSLPNTVEDVFTSTGSNNFNVELLYAQQYAIESQLPKYDEFTLEWILDDAGMLKFPLEVKRQALKTTTKDWEKIKFLQGEGPDFMTANLDVLGIDGYNEDQTNTTRSLGAAVVLRNYKSFQYLPKAKDMPGIVPWILYYKRPPFKELFWDQCAKIAVYAGLKRNVMIAAESDFGINYFVQHGLKPYLAPRPKSFDAPNSKLVNKYGAKMTEFSKPKMLGIIQSWIDYFIQYCWFLEIVNDGIAYDYANIGSDWDSIDAVGLGLMRIYDLNIKPKKEPDAPKPRPIGLPSYIQTEDGNVYEA